MQVSGVQLTSSGSATVLSGTGSAVSYDPRDTNKDGVAELAGADIYVTGGGARVIRFNDSTLQYTVVKP